MGEHDREFHSACCFYKTHNGARVVRNNRIAYSVRLIPPHAHNSFIPEPQNESSKMLNFRLTIKSCRMIEHMPAPHILLLALHLKPPIAVGFNGFLIGELGDVETTATGTFKASHKHIR